MPLDGSEFSECSLAHVKAMATGLTICQVYNPQLINIHAVYTAYDLQSKNNADKERRMPEQVKYVLHNINKPKKFGTWDTCNVAVTDTRCIFAKLTSDLLKKAAAEANQKGKEEGKGFFSRWGDQMSATSKYGDRYLNMSADDVLKENPDNFAIDHTEIKAISFKQKQSVEDADKVIRRIYGEVTFDTNRGKTTYQMGGMPVNDIAAMRAVLGDKVRG